jgi:S1-C subfamily serine protease
MGQRLRLGVGADEHSGEGILVTHVLENSPGHFAGLVAGDVILEINRMPINDLIDYSYAVDRSPETMNVKIYNDGQESLITIDLRY